jgi:hypothetical protein
MTGGSKEIGSAAAGWEVIGIARFSNVTAASPPIVTESVFSSSASGGQMKILNRAEIPLF